MTEEKEKNERRRWLMDSFTKKILMALGIYAVFAIIFIILFQTTFMLSLVPSGSMEGTIKTNSIVFSTRYDVDEEDLLCDIALKHPSYLSTILIITQ